MSTLRRMVSLVLVPALLSFATALAASLAADWTPICVPGMWEGASSGKLAAYDGFAWYRCFVKVPEDWKGQSLALRLGAVDDCDETFFNGTKVGGTGRMPPEYKGASGTPRGYRVDPKLVRPGDYNLIAVRVYDAGGSGGFGGGNVSLSCAKGTCDLAGKWQFSTGDDPARAAWPVDPDGPEAEKLVASLGRNGVFAAPRIVPSKTPPKKPLVLWYQKPASRWVEALPVGNGSLGAMVFGRVNQERIQLNVDTLWAGGPKDRHNPKALEALPKVRRLLFDGKNQEATRLAEETMMGIPCRIDSYQTLGDLWLEFPPIEQATEYRRVLDLEEGMAVTQFEIDGLRFTRTVHACPVNRVLVVFLSCRSASGGEPRPGISCTAGLSRPQDAEVTPVASDTIALRGACDGGRGMKFEAWLRGTGLGKFAVEGKNIVVRDASDVVLALAAETSYRHDDPAKACAERIARAAEKELCHLGRDHLAEHRRLFDRVRLYLGPSPNPRLPTDKRLEAVTAGADDPQLVALYFQFGRYLLMGSSRPGCLPANLQGIWNELMKAPWNSDFHTNINLQMNYWPAEVCNLAECHLPLFDLMDSLVEPGGKTAKLHYGAGGWVVHHLTDVWGFTVPADGVWGIWPVGAAWLCQHPYEHYRFGRDKEFLAKRAYPLMKGGARFILDFLVEAPEGTPVAGKLVTNPSHSPENSFRTPDGKVSKFTYAATMDLQIIHDLFTNCIAAIDVLGPDGRFDAEFRAELVSALKRLPPLQVSKRTGALQEWVVDYEEPSPKHRHVSHMFGLFPGCQITPRGTPELARAIRKTLERRGDGGCGWTMAWKACAWARLEDGDRAYKLLKMQLAERTLPNLLDTIHKRPLFQIDGNFSGTAAIAEMLLQSHAGQIALLPALPGAWPEGRVEGLRARGGFEVDIAWKDGRATSAVLEAKCGGRHKIRAPKGQRITEIRTADKPIPLNANADGTLNLDVVAGQCYELTLQ